MRSGNWNLWTLDQFRINSSIIMNNRDKFRSCELNFSRNQSNSWSLNILSWFPRVSFQKMQSFKKWSSFREEEQHFLFIWAQLIFFSLKILIEQRVRCLGRLSCMAVSLNGIGIVKANFWWPRWGSAPFAAQLRRQELVSWITRPDVIEQQYPMIQNANKWAAPTSSSNWFDGMDSVVSALRTDEWKALPADVPTHFSWRDAFEKPFLPEIHRIRVTLFAFIRLINRRKGSDSPIPLNESTARSPHRPSSIRNHSVLDLLE